MAGIQLRSAPSGMTDDVKFTYDNSTRKLTIKDGNEVKVFNLSDDRSEIFYYILKAIDLLDDAGSGADVYDWAKTGNTDLIPNDKLNVGTGPGQIPVLDEEGELPSGTISPTSIFPNARTIETDDDGKPTVFTGGGAL